MRRPDQPLLITIDWIERHCVVPDREDLGRPLELVDEQASFVANHYIVRGTAKAGQKAPAFRFRRSQLVRSQKWGKSPLIAAFVCLEGLGPALFDGWAEDGDYYACADNDCDCGWEYVYEPGEPMGRRWPTPLIQITATSEDQTDNTYDALRPMIEMGPLARMVPHTGEEFIRLPGNGRIDVVTSKARSRLGQRVTFVAQDETGIWYDTGGKNSMVAVAITQRRGLSAMGGRAIETTNAWDPSENSVAQQTYEAGEPDLHIDFRMPPVDLSWTNKRDRRKILQYNYANVPWALANLPTIEAEVNEMMKLHPEDAERFFGNRLVYGSGSWLPDGAWEKAWAQHALAPQPS